jgi:hypothetical protein
MKLIDRRIFPLVAMCFAVSVIAPVSGDPTPTTVRENDPGGFGDRARLQHDAERGDPVAEARLGFSYHTLSPFDDSKAVYWWEKAAKHGMPMSQAALGDAYRDGTGIAKDEYKAILWWRKAAAQGDIESQANLADANRKGLYKPSGPIEEEMLQNELHREEAVTQDHQRRGWDTPFLDDRGELKMIR